MNKQAYNPYLPSWEYIPDGEPYVFGGEPDGQGNTNESGERVYVYGSHDRFGGGAFCLNDYVCWSASVCDLGNWRYEGVIYRREQDSRNKGNRQYLFAPDVQKGPDGRYYLYYVLNMSAVTSVAVCDTPAGEYQFYGHVRYPDGRIWGARRGEVNNFDPGVFMDDNGRVFLYTGFAPFGLFGALVKMRKRLFDGAYCVELEPDMLTIKSGPEMVVPGQALARSTAYEGHAFFEASSMRKINGRYYFVYSSELSHELCYAVSDRPNGGFEYGGTLVSIGDLGLNGNKVALNYLGNTHGGLVEICNQWYVFYHRQTNGHQYSRQACAERIEIRPDGSIRQAEITSCGLNNGPLAATGVFEARIACNLSSADGTCFSRFNKAKTVHPYFTQDCADYVGEVDEVDYNMHSGNAGNAGNAVNAAHNSDRCQYIANMRNGAWAGYKYFAFTGDEKRISVTVRCASAGKMVVSTSREGATAAEIDIKASANWQEFFAALTIPQGTHALYFKFAGDGKLDFRSFSISG